MPFVDKQEFSNAVNRSKEQAMKNFLALTVAVLAAVWIAVFSASPASAQAVPIPNVIGMDRTLACDKLKAAGFKCNWIPGVYNKEDSKKFVVYDISIWPTSSSMKSVPAGTPVKKGDLVNVTYWVKPDQVKDECSELTYKAAASSVSNPEKETLLRQALDKCQDSGARCQAWYDLGVYQNTNNRQADAVVTWKKGLAECPGNAKIKEAIPLVEAQIKARQNPSPCDLLWKEYTTASVGNPKGMLQVSEKVLASSCSAEMKCCAIDGVATSKELLQDYRAAADAYEKRLACKTNMCSINESVFRAKPAQLRQQADVLEKATAAKTKCDSLFQSGNDKASAKHWSGAKIDYDQVIAGCPAAQACTSKFNRGVCKSNLGDLNGALADYDEALKCGGNNPDIKKAYDSVKSRIAAQVAAQACSALIASAKSKLDKGDNKGSAAEYDKAASSCPVPDRCLAISNRGVAKERMGDKNGALSDYEAALGCDPTNATTKMMVANGRYNIGNVHNLAGRYEEAIKMFLSALQLKPDFPEAKKNMSLAYWGKAMESERMATQPYLEKALTDYTSSLAADPTNKKAQEGKARVQAQLDALKKKSIATKR
jgi:tetratricopeptide (TPR) repeat protein